MNYNNNNQTTEKQKEMMEIIYNATNDFKSFTRNIFSASESLFPNGFIAGDYPDSVCDFLQKNKKTARVGPREHFKSTSLYDHFMWLLFANPNRNIECHYFSYQYQMAAYHVAKIKQAIKSNPFFVGLKDSKAAAESVISFTWDGIHRITLEPHGLLEFKRGIHAEVIYVDDPFQDPSNKMILTVIKRINDIIRGQVLDMAKEQIHISGTPQTNDDFFFDKNIMSRFATMITPAEVDPINQIALWPEWMNWEELQARKKEKGEKLYRQEYLCSPTFAEEAFINRDTLFSLVNDKLPDLGIFKKHETRNTVIAGFDIGKKAHPSHLAVFEKYKDKHGVWKRKQIHQKFMDGWEYVKQINYLKSAISNLGIDRLWYDDTRGEFEGFKESGLLPPQMEGVPFTHKIKHSLAAQFDKAITQKTIEFINDRRMLDQILMVTNDLEAIETPEGHGDSFWSVALTFKEEEYSSPEITIIS